MSCRFFASMSALAVVAIAVSLTSTPAAGQATTTQTAWGHPDLQGIWANNTSTPLETPRAFTGKQVLTDAERAQIEARAKLARDGRDRRDQKPGTVTDVGRAYNAFWFPVPGKALDRPSLIVDPPDGRIPALTPQARKRYEEWAKSMGRFGSGATVEGRGDDIEDGTQGGVDGRGTRADHPEERQLSERCLVFGGVPRLPGGYNNHLRIVQTPESVVIEMEQIHDARVIPLDGRPHLPPSIRQWRGDPRGHWEGNTLVVDTTNFTDKAPFRGSFEGLHLTEKFTPVDANTLAYQVTVDDPTTFTKSWTAAFPLTRLDSLVGGDDQVQVAQMFEYACHEGNYGLTGQLSAARAEDRAAEKSRRAADKTVAGEKKKGTQ